MLDYLVLYDSQSGNTKNLAASIFSALPGNAKDLIDITTEKDIPEARLYFIGFCVHQGTCRLPVSDFIQTLKGKDIALFGTCGMGNSPEYYKMIEQKVSAWIEESSRYLGIYLCQGKMPLQVRKKYEQMRTSENAAQMDMFIRNFDMALTHPDEADHKGARNFALSCLSQINRS